MKSYIPPATTYKPMSQPLSNPLKRVRYDDGTEEINPEEIDMSEAEEEESDSDESEDTEPNEEEALAAGLTEEEAKAIVASVVAKPKPGPGTQLAAKRPKIPAWIDVTSVNDLDLFVQLGKPGLQVASEIYSRLGCHNVCIWDLYCNGLKIKALEYEESKSTDAKKKKMSPYRVKIVSSQNSWTFGGRGQYGLTYGLGISTVRRLFLSPHGTLDDEKQTPEKPHMAQHALMITPLAGTSGYVAEESGMATWAIMKVVHEDRLKVLTSQHKVIGGRIGSLKLDWSEGLRRDGNNIICAGWKIYREFNGSAIEFEQLQDKEWLRENIPTRWACNNICLVKPTPFVPNIEHFPYFRVQAHRDGSSFLVMMTWAEVMEIQEGDYVLPLVRAEHGFKEQGCVKFGPRYTLAFLIWLGPPEIFPRPNEWTCKAILDAASTAVLKNKDIWLLKPKNEQKDDVKAAKANYVEEWKKLTIERI